MLIAAILTFLACLVPTGAAALVATKMAAYEKAEAASAEVETLPALEWTSYASPSWVSDIWYEPNDENLVCKTCGMSDRACVKIVDGRYINLVGSRFESLDFWTTYECVWCQEFEHLNEHIKKQIESRPGKLDYLRYL